MAESKTWAKLAALPVGDVEFPIDLPKNLCDQLKEWMLAYNTNLIPQDIYCIQNPWVFRFHDNTKSALATKAVYVVPGSEPPEIVDVTPFHLHWMTQVRRGRSSQRLLVVLSDRFGEPVILRRKRVQSNDFVIWRGIRDSQGEPTALVKSADPYALDDAALETATPVLSQPVLDVLPQLPQVPNTAMPLLSPFIKPELKAPSLTSPMPSAFGNFGSTARNIIDPMLRKRKRNSDGSSEYPELDDNVKEEAIEGTVIGNMVITSSNTTGNPFAGPLTISRRLPSVPDRLAKTTFHFHGPNGAIRTRTLAQMDSMVKFLANTVSGDMFHIGDALKVVVCDWSISNSLTWRKVVGDSQDWDELTNEIVWANGWNVDGAVCIVEVYKKWF